MSHEIRTPLNSILGYAQLLRGDRSIPSHRRDALTTIENSGEHLSRLIDDILDIARIEARKLVLKREPIDFPAFAEQMQQMFAPQAAAKGLDFCCEFGARLPAFVRGDEHRLGQILINLLTNAIKFTSTGSVRLRIEYSGQVAVFQVTDTGEGIPAQHHEEIFQPFRRVNISRGNAIAGSGLGLTICKILTEIMGGEISLKSAPGSGTTFTVRLFLPQVHDLTQDSARRKPQRAQQRERAEILGYAGTRRSVLIADDQQQHRELLRSVLSPLGFTLLEASSGQQCYELALQAQPDLILTDLDMGDRYGADVVRDLREAGFAAPIIVISAHAFAVHREEALAGGADDFIAKPFQIDELLRKLRQHLQLEWIHPQAQAEVAAPTVIDNAPMQLPQGAQLQELEQLAKIGDLHGLGQRLQALQAAEPRYAAFVAHVQTLSKDFRLADIKRLLSGQRIQMNE